MPFRQIDIPAFRRRLGNLMACPSSAAPDSHGPGLDEFFRRGGNCLHLHGEGGETHSRQAAGQWLRRRNIRADFFLCAQICHEGWDPVAGRAIDRVTPEDVATDIASELELLGTNYLDVVYIASPPRTPVESVMDSLTRELADGRIRAFGVRN